jgi:dimethylhistidine N-methyltransferase
MDAAVARERFTIVRAEQASSGTFAGDVRRGLTATPKFLLPHYFYDALGSALFAAICELPEYYVTRAEDEILRVNGAAIAEALGSPVRLLELGSGAARKTRHIIRPLLERQRELDFIPVDVDEGVLASSGRELLGDFSGLSVHAIAGDFRDPAELLRIHPAPRRTRTVVAFLGSSIGNLDAIGAGAMLASLRGALAVGDALLLGADLRKDVALLERAYDDALGVTAAFNRNLLARINRELGANFDLSAFAHRAVFNDAESRMEMHLDSRCAQRVRIGDYEVAFAEGESIHTESSYKYDDDALRRLANVGGFDIAARWTDSNGWFADLLMVAR